MTWSYPYWKSFFVMKCMKVIAIYMRIRADNYLKCYCLI